MSESVTAGTEGASGATTPEGAGSDTSNRSESEFSLARVQREPQWAWEQMRKLQSDRDKSANAEEKLNALVEKNGTTQDWIDQYGSQVVTKALSDFGSIRNSEQVGDVVRAFEQTGAFSARSEKESATETEDEYMTPEEKEIKELRSEVNSLRTGVTAQSFVQGKETLGRHMKEVFNEFQFPADKEQKIRDRVEGQFRTWQNAGDAGEQALKSIMTESGRETIRGIMLSGITAEDLRAAASNVNLRKTNALSELDTEVPNGVGSTGREAPDNVGKSAIEVARDCRADPNRYESR